MRAIEQGALKFRDQPAELALDGRQVMGDRSGAAGRAEGMEARVELVDNLRGTGGEICELRKRGRRHHVRHCAPATDGAAMRSCLHAFDAVRRDQRVAVVYGVRALQL